MNKFVSTALGLVVVGSIGAADPGDGGWLGLDSEINDLASSIAPAQNGANFAVLLRSAVGYSTSDIATGDTSLPGNRNIFGFDLNDVDVAFWGTSGDFTYRVSFDLDSQTGTDLQDAYAQWACGDYANVQMGNFKPHALRSGWIDPENQLFIDRTVLGSTYDMWDSGVRAFGSQEGVNWSLSAQNGDNGAQSSHLWVASLSYDLAAGAGDYEGARGGNDELNATLGVSVIQGMGPDKAQGGTARTSDNLSTVVELNGNMGQFGFSAEWADIDSDDSGTVASDFGVGGVATLLNNAQTMPNIGIWGNTNPFSVTGSYLVTPDVEGAVRYEDLDDENSTELLSVVANYYRSGNNAKWQAQYTAVTSSNGEADGSYYQIGLTVGASR